jgi:hypothetical protein
MMKKVPRLLIYFRLIFAFAIVALTLVQHYLTGKPLADNLVYKPASILSTPHLSSIPKPNKAKSYFTGSSGSNWRR